MLEKIPTIVLVATGGALGAVARYIVGTAFLESKPLPWGTLAVNVLGSLLLGFLVALFRLGVLDSPMFVFLGVGFMGSFTTMSSFAVETIFLSEESLELAAINVVLMLTTVLVGAFIGRTMALYLLHVGEP